MKVVLVLGILFAVAAFSDASPSGKVDLVKPIRGWWNSFFTKVKQYSSATVNTVKDLYNEHASDAVGAIKSAYQSKREEGRNIVTAAAITAKDMVWNNGGKAMRVLSDTYSENLDEVQHPPKRRRKGRKEKIRND